MKANREEWLICLKSPGILGKQRTLPSPGYKVNGASPLRAEVNGSGFWAVGLPSRNTQVFIFWRETHRIRAGMPSIWILPAMPGRRGPELR